MLWLPLYGCRPATADPPARCDGAAPRLAISVPVAAALVAPLLGAAVVVALCWAVVVALCWTVVVAPS